MRQRLVWALVMLLLLTGCGANRSWSGLAASNGFSGPVELSEDRGDGQLVLFAWYGKCRIRLLTHKPWYDDYTVTYLPANANLADVSEATASKLSVLPAEYAMGDCVLTR